MVRGQGGGAEGSVALSLRSGPCRRCSALQTNTPLDLRTRLSTFQAKCAKPRKASSPRELSSAGMEPNILLVWPDRSGSSRVSLDLWKLGSAGRSGGPVFAACRLGAAAAVAVRRSPAEAARRHFPFREPQGNSTAIQSSPWDSFSLDMNHAGWPDFCLLLQRQIHKGTSATFVGVRYSYFRGDVAWRRTRKTEGRLGPSTPVCVLRCVRVLGGAACVGVWD